MGPLTSLPDAARSKNGQWIGWFIFSAGCILTFTGAAKVISALGRAEVLAVTDPIFGLSFRWLLLIVGLLELVVAGICITTANRKLSLSLIAWLATCFVLYRGGLASLGWNRPCSCLGNLTDAIHIAPEKADLMMKLVLVYLLAGCIGALFAGKEAVFVEIRPRKRELELCKSVEK